MVEGLGGEGFAPHGEKPSHLLQVGGARLIGSQQWSICKEGVSLIGEKIDFFDREKKKVASPARELKGHPLGALGSQQWSICKEGVSLMGSQKSSIFQ